MVMVRARRLAFFFPHVRAGAILSLWLAFATIGTASELDDAMQLYFGGSYDAAVKLITGHVESGATDARLFYFRGLAAFQLGQPDAAQRDFQRGAELETQQDNSRFGIALQRVQGVERLELEKYRRLARLRSRTRIQPLAPVPVARPVVQLAARNDVLGNDALDNVAPATPNQPAEIASAVRLASEIPLSLQAQPNPFVDSTESLLSDRMPAEPVIPAAAEQVPSNTTVSGKPVGTGVADTIRENPESGFGDSDSFQDDPFGLDNLAGNGEMSSDLSTDRSSTRSKSGGIFGAVFRAIGKATVPVNPAGALPAGMNPLQAGSSDNTQAEDEPSDADAEDPFGF